MDDAYESILPHFDVFTAAPGPQAPPGGQMLGRVPMRRAASFMMNPGLHAMRGIGQDTPPLPAPGVPQPAIPPPGPGGTAPHWSMPTANDWTMPTWAAVLVVGAVGVLSYQIGKAMTPSGHKPMTWGLIAIPLGLFTGPLGLGGMAVYANYGAR